MAAFFEEWLRELWRLLVQAGPALLIGFAAAGVIHAFVPSAWLVRHIGGRGLGPIVKAAVVGIPLPLCSCSVVPTAAALRRRGASRGATAAFAVATPEIDAPSITLSWAVLGPAMAVARPIVAFATAVAAGLAIERWGADRAVDAAEPGPCDDGPGANGCATDCCGAVPMERPQTVTARTVAAMRYAAVDLPADLAGWLIAGFLISALIGVLVPPGWIEEHVGSGMGAMLIALVVGLPLYVCATASTPLAAALIAAGFSPGAALVFVLAGPATNTTTMAWLLRDFGWRSLAIYVVVIAAAAVGAGLAFDALLPLAWTSVTTAEEGEEPGSIAAAALVAALLALGVLRRLFAAPGRCS